ncbi:MAG TPA: exodeoxyribonuclease VII large subunit [Nitrospiraceae bacterium]|nr:exodeoxyribonuclease VII large subunit [Nitrospiraceae bacterium]
MAEWTRRIYTVSQLTLQLREQIEPKFSDLWLEGEVSNLRSPESGHLYFTLKDRTSQLRAVLFRSAAQRLRFSMREGLHIIVHGRLAIYEPRGEYQAVLDYVEPKGIGALQIALEQLKEKLAREGLFDGARKRPLPLLPQCVGLVTSLSGAVIRDMVTVLRRRCPLLSILIVPVPVQGEGASHQIASAIRQLSASGDVDVMIVGRGGGTLEDLWAFNEEVVVRAIAESAVPVVSAVGHEIDYTLADFAADYRAPTPSAAAEAVAPALDDLMRLLRDLHVRQERGMKARLALIQHQMTRHCGTLPILILHIQRRVQRLDDVRDRLGMSVKDSFAALKQQVRACCHGLDLFSPKSRLKGQRVLIPQLSKRLDQRIHTMLMLQRRMIQSLAGALDNLSPLAILARGYSLVQTVPEGKVVRKAEDVASGDTLHVRLAEGRLLCGVHDVLPNS